MVMTWNIIIYNYDDYDANYRKQFLNSFEILSTDILAGNSKVVCFIQLHVPWSIGNWMWKNAFNKVPFVLDT